MILFHAGELYLAKKDSSHERSRKEPKGAERSRKEPKGAERSIPDPHRPRQVFEMCAPNPIIYPLIKNPQTLFSPLSALTL